MPEADWQAAELVRMLEGAPEGLQSSIENTTELAPEEDALLRTVLHHGDDPARSVVLMLLDKWDELKVSERIAALLVLAEQLRLRLTSMDP